MICDVWPGFCDDPPNACLAVLLMAPHAAAGLVWMTMLVVPGPHSRGVEFWLMVVYWAGLAGWLLLPTTPHEAFVSARVSFVVAVLIPVNALVRFVVEQIHIAVDGKSGTI